MTRIQKVLIAAFAACVAVAIYSQYLALEALERKALAVAHRAHGELMTMRIELAEARDRLDAAAAAYPARPTTWTGLTTGYRDVTPAAPRR
jgi:hypothetical protein